MKIQKYKMTGKAGLFGAQEDREKLSALGNPLEQLSRVVDFEMFRRLLEERLINQNKRNNAGARPFDVVLMIKILILQRYYGLGDRQIEFQILDRSSFKLFLGLQSGDKVPDEKTVWAFREKLTKSGLVTEVFDLFMAELQNKGYIMNEGKMVDASFTTAPRQRNTRDENKAIKEGHGKELWSDQPNKQRQKDVDARWTQKNDVAYYGYKNHTKVDAKSKLIDGYVVTDASVHDSQALGDLISEQDAGQALYADGAYASEQLDEVVKRCKMINRIHQRGYRNRPLTDDQKKSNALKSKTRARVEHVYAFMEQSMHGLMIRCVGMDRAKGVIGLINLTYNMFRLEQIERLKLA